jgi:carbamoyl-phosphate synthase large subunit
MNILITSAGQRVSLARAFQHELKEVFPKANVFTTDIHPRLSAACHVSDRSFKLKQVTHADYISDLLKLCVKENIRMVVPTIDTELLPLARHKPEFAKEGIELIISSEPFVAICRDKRESNRFFMERKISVPQEFDRHNPTFPLFIKPVDGSSSINACVIENQSQITTRHMANEKLLFMEYIDQKEYDEYTVDMYFGKDNTVKCIVPRKRISVRAGEVNKALTCKNLIVSALKEKLGRVQGAVGCLTVQVFLHKENRDMKGIEINPRFGGGYPLSYRAGANFPKWLIQEYLLNQEIHYSNDWEDNLLMLRYDDEVMVHGFAG